MSTPPAGGETAGPIESAAREAIAAANDTPGAAVAVKFSDTIEQLLRPHVVSVNDWAAALITGDDWASETAEDSVLGILAQILTARTPEEALASLELDRAREMCGDEPGGHSALLEIRGARPMRSTYDVGAPTYAIVDAVYVHNGEPVRFTSGAIGVQAVLIAMIGNGWLPFQAVLTIRRRATAAGFYPMNLEAGG